MKRRQVLKILGLGTGFIVIGPGAFGLLQSCINEPVYDWHPQFLSASHGMALKNVLNVIFPSSDTPGALELNIAQFIDSYMAEVADPTTQDKFQRSAVAFSRSFKKEFDKDQAEGNEEEFEQLIKKYLKATPAQQDIYTKINTETQDAQESGSELQLDADAGAFNYLMSVRGMGIWAWKNSEEIGEHVMWYDPVPGEYIACGATAELGNGKAMSL